MTFVYTSIQKTLISLALTILNSTISSCSHYHHHLTKKWTKLHSHVASAIPSPITKILKKNRDDARAQQNQESPKEFHVSNTQTSSLLFVEFDSPFPGKIKHYYSSLEASKKIMNGREVGIARCQGKRLTMEDMDLTSSFSFQINQREELCEIYAVFDGYQGNQASMFLKDHFVETFKQCLEEHQSQILIEENVFNVLKSCFQKLDTQFGHRHEGSTATVAIFLDKKIWIANVGNCRAILVNNEETLQASEDALVTDIFRAIGGKDILTEKEGVPEKKVFSSPMSKIKLTKDSVTLSPKITLYDLEEHKSKEGYLLIASDGLYKIATTNEVGQSIQQMIQEKESVENMAQRLTYAAVVNFASEDNTTVMVIKI